MTVLLMTLVALALAVGWAVDAWWQRSEMRREYDRLQKRVKSLGDQLLAVRRRGVGLPPRPVVRWHEEIERRVNQAQR